MNNVTPTQKVALLNAILLRKRDMQHTLSYPDINKDARVALQDEYGTLCGVEIELLNMVTVE